MQLGENELRLDRAELKVLASDSRVEILRNLKGRNYTVSELAQRLGQSKSTVHEHVNKLHGAGLVEKADNYTDKWVYYRLSRRGKSLFEDSQKRVVVILSTILVIVGMMQLAAFFYNASLFSGSQMYLATEADYEGTELLGEAARNLAVEKSSVAEEQRILSSEDSPAMPESGSGAETYGDETAMPPRAVGGGDPGLMREEREKTPWYIVGAIGFLSAGFMLAHWYKGKPLKLNLALAETRKKK